MNKLSCILRGLLFVFLLSVSLFLRQVYAQIKVGVQAGANTSFFSPQVESKAGVGTMFGALVEYQTKSPWLLRGEVNWAHNYMILKNFDMNSSVSRVLRYDISLYSVHIPISVGYKVNFSPRFSLVLRSGMWVRYGLNNSFGVVTSTSLNNGDTSSPTSMGVYLYRGASGRVMPSVHNPLGNYHYPKFSRPLYGLLVSLDAGLDSHWQVGLRYEHGTGHNFQSETSGDKKLFLRSLAVTLSYFF